MKRMAMITVFCGWLYSRDIPGEIVLILGCGLALLLLVLPHLPRPSHVRVSPAPVPAVVDLPLLPEDLEEEAPPAALLKEINKTRRRLYSLYDRRDREDALGTNQTLKSYRGLLYDIDAAERRLRNLCDAAGIEDDYDPDDYYNDGGVYTR